MVTAVPAGICAAATAGLMIAEVTENSSLRALCKPVAAGAFVVSAVVLGATQIPVTGSLLLAGLILGALGDVLLLPEGNGTPFKLGIASFGLSHVAYVAMFASLGLNPLGLVSLLVLLPLAWFIWTQLRDGVKKLAIPVMGYIAVITVMVAVATCAVLAEPATGQLVLMGAATLFFVSDLCVARHRFVQKDVRNRLVGQPLYFGAQLLFGFGVSLL